MAKRNTSSRKSATSKVNPAMDGAPETDAVVDGVTEKKEKKAGERKRTPAAHYRRTVGDRKAGERANGLVYLEKTDTQPGGFTEEQREALGFRWDSVCVLEGRAAYKFGARQFAKPSYYARYMAAKCLWESGLYMAKANALASNPATDVHKNSAQEKAEKLAQLNALLEQAGAVQEQMLELAMGGDVEGAQALKADLDHIKAQIADLENGNGAE